MITETFLDDGYVTIIDTDPACPWFRIGYMETRSTMRYLTKAKRCDTAEEAAEQASTWAKEMNEAHLIAEPF